MFSLLSVSYPEEYRIKIGRLKIFFFHVNRCCIYRCEIKFLLAHKYKQVISGLLFSFNACTDIKSSTLGYGFWAAYFLIFFFGMDLLFDFVKHQLKTALPGLLQTMTLHIYTEDIYEKNTSLCQHYHSDLYPGSNNISYREMCRPSKLKYEVEIKRKRSPA